MSIANLKNTSISHFVKGSLEYQQDLISGISISELKRSNDVDALKKLVAMKVLMEARNAVENQNLLSLTAHFRNLLSFFGLTELALSAADGTSTDHFIRGNEVETINGYRLFHINDMGYVNWNRKFFNIHVTDDNNIRTGRVNTRSHPRPNQMGPITTTSESLDWELLDEQSLKELFAKIKKEARYENTFGYDVLSAAMFCANALLDIGLQTNILIFLIAAILNVAIYATVAPVALTLMVIEHLIINPIKAFIGLFLTDNKHEAFIKEVCDNVPPQYEDVAGHPPPFTPHEDVDGSPLFTPTCAP